jgi:hypothetical protein
MKLRGEIFISNKVFGMELQITNQDITEAKKSITGLLKDKVYQVLYEEVLDKCKSWQWSINQSYKIKNKLDKAEIHWIEI